MRAPLRIRRMDKGNIVQKLFAAVFTAAILTGCAASATTGNVGAQAPNWTERTAGGTPLSLASLRGKPVYLNFFATWCPPCNEEAPGINALQKQYASTGLTVVGVDELENAKKAQSFVKKYALVYPVVIDDGTLQGQYQVNGLPVHVFIDRRGVIKSIHVGEMSKTQIAGAIRTIVQ
jgi:cytochrome c biogenesis protein CcmG/thiol:disulfide interchange protein DsbE